MANEQYQAALARAEKLGVEIMGRGRWTDGRALFLVSSATTSKPHIVQCVRSGSEIECDCPTRRGVCMHRAVVRRQLEADAKATAEHMQRVRRAMEEERAAARTLQAATARLARQNAEYARKQAEAAKRETAPLRRPASVSMWAS